MRHLKPAMLSLLLATGPAAAQDLVFSLDDTLYCLGTAGTFDEMRGCIGASANACMNATSMGGSTIGMSSCMDRELTYWDDRLNASYQALRASERAEDADMAGLPGVVSQADALRDMQRAWIRFRDATCDFERAQWTGGTGGGPATVGCLLRMTGEQTLYLERIMVDF